MFSFSSFILGFFGFFFCGIHPLENSPNHFSGPCEKEKRKIGLFFDEKTSLYGFPFAFMENDCIL